MEPLTDETPRAPAKPKPRAARTPPTAVRPLTVDARELAVLLSISVRTVREWDAKGKIPAGVRVVRRVVWVLTEVEAWLAAGAVDRAAWTAMKSSRSR